MSDNVWDVVANKPEKFKLEIERVDNGYILTGTDELTVIQDEEKDVKTLEQLLWSVLIFFGGVGSKHDEERVEIKVAKKGVDY